MSSDDDVRISGDVPVLRRRGGHLPRTRGARHPRPGLRGLLQPVERARHLGRHGSLGGGQPGRRDGLVAPASAQRVRLADRADLPAIVAIYNEAVADRFATADLDPITTDARAGWFAAHDP